MSLDADIQLLSAVPLFSDFKKEHLRLLAFGAERRKLDAGTKLYLADSYSDGGYVIAMGQVDLFDRNNRLISSHGMGELVGELALISEVDYSATAIAAHTCQLMKIPRPLFRRMLEEYPELAEQLQKRIASSLQKFVDQLDRVREDLEEANRKAVTDWDEPGAA